MKTNEKFVTAETPSFISFRPDANECVYDDSDYSDHPTRFYTFTNPITLQVSELNASTYGYVSEGSITLTRLTSGRTLKVLSGEYFSSNEPIEIQGNGVGILVETIGQKVFNTLGGSIETEGRLKYIDGCTDSLLIPPVMKGMSCLNHLHFPEGIEQTMHTHPTVRCGIVAKGKGLCHTPFGDLPLVPNQPFIILPKDERTDGRHCFFTDSSPMDVIAFHPDSDFGPEHENHPMINRTIVEGTPANQIEEIQTQ